MNLYVNTLDNGTGVVKKIQERTEELYDRYEFTLISNNAPIHCLLHSCLYIYIYIFCRNVRVAVKQRTYMLVDLYFNR